MDRSAPLTIDDLAQQAGVPVRTVRYYISQGLLPGPDGRGKAATYDADHLARLRLIRRLADGHVPLAEQRERLERLSPGEVRALLDEDQRQAAALQRASQAPSPRGYISGLLDRARATRGAPLERASPSVAAPAQLEERWRRWELAPGVELHARDDAVDANAHLIRRLLQVSREARGRRPARGTAFDTGDPFS